METDSSCARVMASTFVFVSVVTSGLVPRANQLLTFLVFGRSRLWTRQCQTPVGRTA